MSKNKRIRLETKIEKLKKKLSLCFQIHKRANLNAKISRLILKLER